MTLARGRARRPGAPAGECADDTDAAREAALRLLERLRRTRADLVRRLRDQGYTPRAVDTALERLAAVGLVDDAEYARAYLAGRRGRRPAGLRRLELELRVRGVSPEDIAHGLARLEAERGPTDDVAMARRVVAQAARRYAALDPRKRRQRLYALLIRRGFDGETIEQAMREE